MACADAACERFGWIDPGRLGILGGYMSSWTISHTDRFLAACSERACNNLLTMEYTADTTGFLRSYQLRSHSEAQPNNLMAAVHHHMRCLKADA
jgi:dipeptidyl aminopeptidase/acylaminoacyl peptidase